MRSITNALVILSFAIPAYGLHAQSPADSTMPRASSWGAEAGINGGFNSLLYFSSPRLTWLAGLKFLVDQSDVNGQTFVGAPTSTTSTLKAMDGRVGLRWWRGEQNSRLRPLVGVGVGAMYSSQPAQRVTEGSLYAELGAAYFFTPHLSLGASGDLTAARRETRLISNSQQTADQVNTSRQLRGNLVRVNASVYF